jgi:Ca-activated chloride channel family protein
MQIMFQSPEYLLFLFSIPLAVLIHFLSLSFRKSKAIKFANFEAISRIKGVDLYSKNIFGLIVVILLLICFTFSLAEINVTRSVNTVSSSIVIAIDNSKSMEANDLAPTRLDAAKEEAIKFVDNLPYGGRVGVISFSGNSFIESEMSDDLFSVKNSIKDISLTNIGGTDIYEAIISSSNLLSKESMKTVVLFSDGQINVGGLDEAIEYANERGVVVNTIAMGTDLGGQTSYGLSKTDLQSLNAVSFNTGGSFVNFTEIYDLSTQLELKNVKVTKNMSKELIIFSLFLILVYFFVINYFY